MRLKSKDRDRAGTFELLILPRANRSKVSMIR